MSTDIEHMQAIAAAHALELAGLQARVLRLEAILQEHGIDFPNGDPALFGTASRHGDLQHLRACRAVVRGAYELLPALENLRALVGSGMELLEEEWV